MRVGIGFDAHRLEPGRPLVLGGVEIPFPLGLAGHSDADVVCHALADAILGALGAGDIGGHFPDTDPRWKGASSLVLLRKVAETARGQGYRVGNADVTVIAESPKIAPFVGEMRERLARCLGVEAAAVSIKGKTTEGLGFCGRGEGITALAVVLLVRVPGDSP